MSISRLGDKIFPVTVGAVTLVGCIALLIRMAAAPRGSAIFADQEAAGEDAEAPHGLWTTLAWFGGLLLLSSLVGFVIAATLFFLAFLRVRAGVSWVRTVILSAAGIGFICFLAGTLGRDFPPGLLQEYVKLPWPLT